MVLFDDYDGKTNTDIGFEAILSEAIFFVYKCRLDKSDPFVQAFICEPKHMYKIDEQVHRLEMSHGKVLLKWFPYQTLVE